MELASDKSQQHLKEKVVSAIKKDARFAMFFMGPSLKEYQPFNSQTWAKKIGLSERDARYFESDLLRVGLWLESEKGMVVKSDFLDLGELSVIEHMTLSMNILSRMTETGPCWYEALFVSTTHDLKKEFLANINRVMKDFIAKSSEADGETVLAWTHGSLDYLKDLEQQALKKSQRNGEA